MKVFCVIPAFNEAKNIAAVIDEVKPLVDELVVVDDGSTDQTGNLAEAAGATVLKHIINRGQGASLRTGTAYCLDNGAEVIIHFDADGQFLGGDIVKIIEPIRRGEADVVYGSRFLEDRGHREMPFSKKHFIMPLAKAVNRIFFQINLTDPQSGFRALSRRAAETISWQQDRMAHCSEIMFEVKRNELKVREIPIVVVYCNFGQSLFGGFRILKDFLLAMIIN